MDNIHGNGQSFERFLEVGRRRIWLGLAVFLLGLALTLTFVWTLPPLYQASTTLAVANSATLGGGRAPPSGFGGIDPPPLDAVTQQVLGQRNLAGIITRFNLYPDAPKPGAMQNLTERLRKSISIEKQQTQKNGGRQETLGFTLSYNNENPKTAAAVANALAISYQTTARQIRGSQAKQNATALAASMEVVGAKLAKQQAKIEQFNNKHLGALPQQQQASLALLSHLYTQLQTDKTGELNAINQRADLLAQINDTSKDNINGNLNLAQLKQKLSSLRLRYTDQYPDVVNLKRRIAAMEAQQANGAGASAQVSPLQGQLNDINLQLQQFQANEKKVQAEIAKAQGQLAQLPITGQRLAALNQNAVQTNDVYASLLKQYEQARVVAATAGKGAPPYTITQPALVPTASLGPNRPRYAVMFIILCAILAFVIVFIAEKRDTTFHTLEEVREFTTVPILATVPVIHRRRDGFARFTKASAVVLVLICCMAILVGIGYAAGHGNHALARALSSTSKT